MGIAVKYKWEGDGGFVPNLVRPGLLWLTLRGPWAPEGTSAPRRGVRE